jgi:hypothetical protein
MPPGVVSVGVYLIVCMLLLNANARGKGECQEAVRVKYLRMPSLARPS